MFPANMGNLCAFLAVLGIFYMSNSHSDIVCILVVSGCVEFNPFLVFISNLHGLFIHTQCVVVLLSVITSVAFAVLSGVFIVD